MNVGSIDFGQVGDTPPIFAQAAGAAIVYVAANRSPTARAFSSARTPTSARSPTSKASASHFTKGSSAHNVTIIALEKAGLGYGDITPVYLSPPTPPPPSPAAASTPGRCGIRTSPSARKHGGRFWSRQRARQDQFLLPRQPGLRAALSEASARGDRRGWPRLRCGRRTIATRSAKALAEVTGVELAVQTIAANRSTFAIGKLDDEIVTTQQAVADRFHKLGLIPKRRSSSARRCGSPPQS